MGGFKPGTGGTAHGDVGTVLAAGWVGAWDWGLGTRDEGLGKVPRA